MGIKHDIHENEHTKIYVGVTLATSIAGALASLLMILLIFRMRSSTGGYTGHILLVLMMSFLQFIYDITFFFRMVECSYYSFIVANFFQIFTSTAASLISNWISFIALLIVVYKKKFDANYYFYLIFLTSMMPSLIIGLCYFFSVVAQDNINTNVKNGTENAYNFIRLVLIFINFLFCGIIIFQVQQFSGNSKKQSPQEVAIRVLSRRMIFYPIIQAIGRLCFSYYELQYGFQTNAATSNSTEYDWLLAIAIITPLVSVGYLAIFLIMQPEGIRQFIAMLKLEPVSATKSRHKPSPSNDLKESIDESKEHTRSTGNSNHTFSRADNFSTISNTTLIVSQTLIGYGDVHSYSEQDDEMLLSSLDRIVIDIQRNSDHNATRSDVDNVRRKSSHANDLEMGQSVAYKLNELSIDHNSTANPILEN